MQYQLSELQWQGRNVTEIEILYDHNVLEVKSAGQTTIADQSGRIRWRINTESGIRNRSRSLLPIDEVQFSLVSCPRGGHTEIRTVAYGGQPLQIAVQTVTPLNIECP